MPTYQQIIKVGTLEIPVVNVTPNSILQQMAIWLKERSLVTIPKHTFDIEHTTDFSKALHRAYQLRDFKTTFYVVSSKRKNEQFKKRLETDPYKEISDRIFFRSYEDIISLYEAAIRHSELKEKFIIDI